MNGFLIKKTHVLFLANVFPTDCPSENDILDNLETSEESLDIFEESEEKISDMYYETDYESLPMFFISKDRWPKSTNLLCWSCTLKPLEMPWFIPIGINKKSVTDDDMNEENIFSIENISEFVSAMPENYVSPKTKEEKNYIRHGCFCSPFCAKRYINNSNDPKITNKWQANKLLKQLYEEINNIKISDIPESEDKNIMMQFCGGYGITAQEYRKRTSELKVILFENI
jgi:hypothetical protein